MIKNLIISALTCLSITLATVAIEQTIIARDTRIVLDNVLAAQAQQPVKLGWDI